MASSRSALYTPSMPAFTVWRAQCVVVQSAFAVHVVVCWLEYCGKSPWVTKNGSFSRFPVQYWGDWISYSHGSLPWTDSTVSKVWRDRRATRTSVVPSTCDHTAFHWTKRRSCVGTWSARFIGRNVESSGTLDQRPYSSTTRASSASFVSGWSITCTQPLRLHRWR